MSTKGTFEIRALTMMNFSIPPSLSLSEIKKRFPKDFISFQNHQIIQISDPKDSLPVLYKKVINNNRIRQRKSLGIDSHITQSITIIGNPGQYWDSPAPVCFITFLQTKDFVPSDSKQNATRYEQLKDYLAVLLKESLTQASFALYYSFDFCDYILFTKGTTAAFHNDLLWKLTMDEGSAFLGIRDSYTFYTFSIPYLTSKSKNQNATDNSMPIMALSARISVYSSDALNDLITRLNALGLFCDRFKLFGRYDIELRTDVLTISQIRAFIQCIDEAFRRKNSSDAYAPFGGYEFMPFSESNEFTYFGVQPHRDPAFVDALKKLFIQSTDMIDKRLADYVYEAKQSMHELILNGFSTEFILGTLPPFCAAIKNLSLTPIDNTQRVFYALNTLTLCMMHGERRFIQAPAFGASYFDIPAKLFAYYATVINTVKGCYKELDKESSSWNPNNDPWEKESYEFLMVPDFREGIFVYPIERQQVLPKQEHLCLIYLSEEFFYDPIKAIYLIAQETAHYVGVRHREDRARAILHTISCVLICVLLYRNDNLSTSTLDDLYDGKSSAGLLAQCLEQKMIDCYTEGFKEDDPYRFDNIWRFLAWYENGNYFFTSRETKESIITSWLESINNYTPDTEMKDRIASFQRRKFGSSISFLTEMQNNSDDSYFTNRILANEIAEAAAELKLTMGGDDWEIFDNICKNIISVFREAFADYRMIQVLGDGFNTTVYKELLKKLVPKGIDYDTVIRHDAVLSTAGYIDVDFMFKSGHGYEGNTQYLAIRGVKEYLGKCAVTYHGSTMADAIRIFSEISHPEEQCQLILRELDRYMGSLIDKSKQ